MGYYNFDKYIILEGEKVGTGAFGKVCKAAYIPGKGPKDLFLACKILELPGSLDDLINDVNTKNEIQGIKQEISSLLSFNHPNVIKLFDVKLDYSKKYKVTKIFIFMEFCNQGDLTKFLKRGDLSEEEILYYFAQIINGFKQIRKKSIIHRDIKPENILVNNKVIKIADFGFSKVNNDIKDKNVSFLGTPLTMSPQVLSGLILIIYFIFLFQMILVFKV